MMTRARLLDGLLVLLLLGLMGWILWRVQFVLEYRWDWAAILPYFARWDTEQQQWISNLLLDGFITTLRLSLCAGVLACVIGLLMGLGRVSQRLLPRLIAASYVELVRNVPPLVFLFIFYFFLSAQLLPLLGLEQRLQALDPAWQQALTWLVGPLPRISDFLAGALCLALFEGAYVTEIVRGGIQAIPRGQWEGGRAIGLNGWQLQRLIILPQALRQTLPPLSGQLISLVKDSSLIALISIPELTYSATEVANSTGRIFEVWIAVALLYWLLCFSLSLASRHLEQRLRR